MRRFDCLSELYGEQLILEQTRSRTVTKLSSSKSNWRRPSWSKRLTCQLLSCYVFAQELIAPLICSIAMSLHDIISELFYLSWHCANLYCTVWDSVGVLVMHGTHTISMLMRATHLRMYVHLKTSPVVQAVSSSLYHWRRLQCRAAHGWMVCVGGVHVLCSTCTVYVHHCRSNRLCHFLFRRNYIRSAGIYFTYTMVLRYIWIIYTRGPRAQYIYN